MTSLRFKLAAGAAVLLCALVFTNTPRGQAQEPEGNYGVGIPEVFLPKYLAYRGQQLASGSPDVMRIKLGNVKGLSKSFVDMAGEMAVDLQSGAYQLSLNGLTPLQTYSLWLVDGAEGDVLSPLPDTLFRLTTLLALTSSTVLNGQLLSILPFDFTIDRVVVVPGLLSGGEALAAGSVNVFQKIFFRRLTLVNESTGAVLFEETTPPPSLFEHVPDLAAATDEGSALAAPSFGLMRPESSSAASSASSSSNRSVKLDKLISQGAQLFFEETFNGNGRTCGTCHPASNNLTIDPAFIKTRPANDPLFVAEFNPTLAQLERPKLMRQFGLILENLDGFTPSSRFVMRGVPHTLGLQVSLTRDTTLPKPPAEMTGWSGDGAPVTGSLRDFAIGAVTQHFPKNLARVEGRDFKLPREHQLDAMEAFQLSTGRDKDLILSKITFTNANLNTGKTLFINGTGDPQAGGTCNFCHTNAGALAGTLQNENRNFNTNVEDVLHPARAVLTFPRDGGFGRTPNANGAFGNETFNTAPVVEAADTAPFFHNNVVTTLEGVVAFYSGPEFNNPQRPAAARFNFNQTQINQIADFMRGVNTLQNISVARRELAEILANRGNPRREQDTRLQTAFDETQDAIDVLSQDGLLPSAVTQLTSARNLIANAQFTTDADQRRALIQQAIAKLDAARNAVATIAP